MLLSESEGEFSYAEWEEACEVAEGACCKEEGGVGVSEGMEVEGVQGEVNLEEWVRGVVRGKVVGEQRWRGME